jgi:hypothetical protein
VGWDKRGYYYRVRKVAGRVTRQYCGTGEAAALIAQQDAQERERRRQERLSLRREKARLEALDAELKDLDDTTDLVARAALLAAGYRQHKRGEWRKRREPSSAAGQDHRADAAPGASCLDPTGSKGRQEGHVRPA